MDVEMRERFYERLNEVVNLKQDNHFYITDQKYRELLAEVKNAKEVVYKKSIHYRRLKRYDIMTVGGEERLIAPNSSENVVEYLRYEELFSAIHETHVNTGHGGRTRTLKELSRSYKNVTTESVVIYLRLCQTCLKKQKETKAPVHEKNSRAQLGLISMQPDDDFKYIFIYQDCMTQFVLLRALKTTEEVAFHLLDIFTTFGAPCVLQSDYEFCNISLCDMWNIEVIYGKSFVNDVETMLAAWMEVNQTLKWSEGVPFVQAMKNNQEGVKCSPYEAMFGLPMKRGLAKLPVIKLASEVGSYSAPSTSQEGQACKEAFEADEMESGIDAELAQNIASKRKISEICESAKEGYDLQGKKIKKTSC